MYPVGKAIAQAISQADASITVNLSASEGSVSNALALQNGEIDLGQIEKERDFNTVLIDRHPEDYAGILEKWEGK